MKKTGCALLFSLLVLIGHSQESHWIKFNWVGDSIGAKYFDKTAIDIPIQIENMPYKFVAQFDLGATSSMLYGNEITPYLAVCKELKDEIDTSFKTWIDSKPCPTFKGVKLKLGNVPFCKIDFGFYTGYGDSLTADSVKSNTVKEIGTIGSDFFKDKVLIIDYPNQQICIANAIPKEFVSGFNFIDLKFVDGVILIPVQIGNKKENLIFDTGSSLFTLSTNEKNANEISGENETITDSLKISSWGKEYYAYGKKVNEEVKIGNMVMPKALVYYDKREWNYFFVSHDIWGITGNAYFWNSTVIIDFKTQKFGVSNSLK
jgi:hypothetical protein